MEAKGTAGGILLFWHKRRLSLVESEYGSYSLSCLFRMVEDDFQWMFSGVYSVERSSKEFFWEELGPIRGIWNDPWCLGGDFNEILLLKDPKVEGSPQL